MTNVRAEAGTIQDEPAVFHCARKEQNMHTHGLIGNLKGLQLKESNSQIYKQTKKEYFITTQSKK